MNNYQKMIDEITDIVCNNEAQRKSYVLIGDNSSGKSDILRNVIQKRLEGAVYFIDSVNRSFNTDLIEFVSRSYEAIRADSFSIVSERIDPFYFNLRDTLKPAPEQLFRRYHDGIERLCKSFLGIDLQIKRENVQIGTPENKVIIDGNEVKLSSGYQAAVRLFCEILFFEEAMKRKGWNRGLAVIDEIDEYLSPKYSADILNFLQKEFPAMDFLVTTHSLDLVKNIHNTNLIILYHDKYEIWGDAQLEGGRLAEDIFTSLFFEDKIIHKSDNDVVDEELRRLLNLKIAELWDEKAQRDLDKIGLGKLKPHQKMIYRQIEEW
ncbi:MAG: hypothetical protein HFG70_07490 [Hungatella sp.]|jgi:predicted ATP-dependent endonuclease of OLD family|nr:hypothetical protein [Hungatella sp.]